MNYTVFQVTPGFRYRVKRGHPFQVGHLGMGRIDYSTDDPVRGGISLSPETSRVGIDYKEEFPRILPSQVYPALWGMQWLRP